MMVVEAKFSSYSKFASSMSWLSSYGRFLDKISSSWGQYISHSSISCKSSFGQTPSWPSIGEFIILKLTWSVTYLDPVSESPTTFLCHLPITLLVILSLFRVLCVNCLVFMVLGLYWNHYRVIHFWHLFSTGGSIFGGRIKIFCRGSREILIATPSLSFGTGRLHVSTWHSMGADGGLAVRGMFELILDVLIIFFGLKN